MFKKIQLQRIGAHLVTLLLVLPALLWAPSVPAALTGKILFSSNSDGDYELYTMNASGSGLTQLTKNTTINEYDAHWTHDGKKIGFVRDIIQTSQTLQNPQLGIMDSNGKNAKYIVDGLSFAFSPDGKKMAYEADGGDTYGRQALFTYDLTTKMSTRLLDMVGDDMLPDWSPDGKKIAFTNQYASGTANFMNIHVMKTDGSGDKNLTGFASSNPGYARRPRWSPDGSKIAFEAVNPNSGLFNICVMKSDGSKQTQLTNGKENGEIYPVWSPDGKHILFAGRTGKTATADGHSVICIMDSDGKNVKLLLDYGDCFPLDWSATAPVPTPTPTPTPTPVSVKVTSINRYGYAADRFQAGKPVYSDRSYTFTSPIASTLLNQAYLRTLNQDKDAVSASFLSFTVDKTVMVLVGLDKRITTLPAWLKGWTKRSERQLINDVNGPERVFYAKKFSKGKITLGSNRDAKMPTGRSMYTVVILPAT